MNVLFHTLSAVGLVVALTDTDNLNPKKIYSVAVACFLLGVMIHGVLDYTPHRYPINSRLDVVLSLILIIGFIIRSRKIYRPIFLLSFVGNILPDLIDLAPSIINKQFGLHFKTFSHIFPWHWLIYSGSLYHGNNAVSFLNHVIILLLIVAILWFRRKDFKRIMGF